MSSRLDIGSSTSTDFQNRCFREASCLAPKDKSLSSNIYYTCMCIYSVRGGTTFRAFIIPGRRRACNRGKRREKKKKEKNETASTEIPTEIPEHGNRASTRPTAGVSRERRAVPWLLRPSSSNVSDEKVLSIAERAYPHPPSPPSPVRNP